MKSDLQDREIIRGNPHSKEPHKQPTRFNRLRHKTGYKIVGSPWTTTAFEDQLMQYIQGIKTMKNKKPNQTSLRQAGDESAIMVPAMNKTSLEMYLNRTSFSKYIKNIPEKRLYNWMRKKLMESVNDDQKKNLIFAALAERIARTAVFLERFDKKFMNEEVPVTSLFLKGAGKSEYNIIQLEHRRCIESFINLKYSYEQKKSTKVLEELRKTIVTETEGDEV